jgi:divalent metal cation (Fe/Co/Zn/Cd) transporter
MRSTAVLIAASIAACIPSSYTNSSEIADSIAAIVVSVIILCTLVPLIQRLINTAKQIVRLRNEKQQRIPP